MRREYFHNYTPIILKRYSNCTFTADEILNEYIYKGYNNLSIFLVGGGGGGSGDGQIRGTVGTGGGGGECITINNLPLKATTLTISIGSGGSGSVAKVYSGVTGKAGGNTTVTYNGTTYTAKGGYGGDIQVMSKNTIFTKYPRGNRKFGGWGGGANVQTTTAYNWAQSYYNYTPEQYIKEYPSDTNIKYSQKGENGVTNPFDSSDTMVYGCGGGGGYDPYDWYTEATATNKTYYSKIQSEFPNYGGDNNAGGGRGGYGDNNASTNCGHNATSYGSGGGGAAFSSGHTYGYGGNGKQGIVILKFS